MADAGVIMVEVPGDLGETAKKALEATPKKTTRRRTTKAKTTE